MNACTGPSRRIRVGAGAEDFDLQLDGPRGPRLLVSCLQRPPKKGVPGTIWSVDLPNDEARPLAMPREVYPAGIELANVDGHTRLYLTNAPPGAHASIEVFDLSGETLVWRESLSTDLLSTPNDLVVLPNGDVYTTNLGLPANAIGKAMVTLFKMRRGAVVKYDARTKQWSRFAEHLSFANGIATDNERLYVNELARKRLHVIDLRNGQTSREIELPGHPDNLRWEVRGRVLNVAMHRGFWPIIRHLGNAKHPSPSLGCRVDVQTNAIEMLYDQPDFHGGSTAMVVNRTLYVSQVVGNEILVIENCR